MHSGIASLFFGFTYQSNVECVKKWAFLRYDIKKLKSLIQSSPNSTLNSVAGSWNSWEVQWEMTFQTWLTPSRSSALVHRGRWGRRRRWSRRSRGWQGRLCSIPVLRVIVNLLPPSDDKKASRLCFKVEKKMLVMERSGGTAKILSQIRHWRESKK